MDTTTSSGEERPSLRGWRLLTLLLLAGILLTGGGLVLRQLWPGGDPVRRAVNRIMETVRAEEDPRGWRRAVAAVRELLFGAPPPATSQPDAGEELGRLGAAAHPYLVVLASDDRSAAVRRISVRVLADGGATNAWNVMERALAGDRDGGVREAAAEGLVSLDPDRAEPLLLAGLAREDARLNAHPGTGGVDWEDVQTLQAIARLLGSMRATNAVGPLLGVLRRGDPSFVQSAAADALGEIGDPRAAPALRELLTSRETQVRSSAIRAIGQLRDRESVPLLLPLMESVATNLQAMAKGAGRGPRTWASGDWEARNTAQALAEAFGRIGDVRATPLMVHAVTNLVEDYDLQTFVEAFSELRDPRAIPALRQMLSERPNVAREAADALAMLGDDGLVRELTALLGGPDRDRRMAAAMALANLGERSVLSHLVELWESGPGRERQVPLLEVLGIVGDATTVPLLARELQSGEESARTQAAWSLGHIGDPAGVTPLLRALSDTNFQVRFAAAFSLAGATNADVRPALERLLTDEEPRVQLAAAFTLAFGGVDSVTRDLVRQMHSTDDWQRLAAAMALLRLNTPEARDRAGALLGDRDKGLRELGRVALERGPVPALAEMLRGGTTTQRHYAARLLFFFEDPAALPALREALRDSRQDVRVAARVTIRRVERKMERRGGGAAGGRSNGA